MNLCDWSSDVCSSDLLNAHSGILEQGLGFEDHRLVDPPRGGLAAHLLHHGREVFGRDIELLGVEAHVALPLVVLLQQRHELVEPEKLLLSVKETCELTGLSERTVRTIMAENEFTVRIGRRTLVHKKKFEKWLDKQYS